MNLFFSSHRIDATTTRITGQEHFHLSRVLRLRVGDAILLNDGEGIVYRAVLRRIEEDATTCAIEEAYSSFNEAPVPVVLALAVMKNPGKMDWVVEKGTELGMTAFQPLLTKRTVSSTVKIARLRTLAETAVKQCLRAVVPAIHEATTLEQTLHAAAGHRLLACHEAADMTCTPENLSFDDRPITLFIGPEGGFADEEVVLFRACGAEILSLGPRRLRGETAAIAALARVIARLENRYPQGDGQVSDITKVVDKPRR
jgi:16S rRNA (uracil1498-N3)-methyltransferase